MRLSPLLLLLAASPVTAQQPALPAVDSIFARFSATTPGCALGVYRDGTLAYARGYGMANLELNVPISPRSVFDIGSTSKQFTAASLVLLHLDGKLSLDDDIRKWIPELPDYGKPITIRHILHHTSGLRDYIGLMVLAGADIDDLTTEQEAFDIIVRQKALNFPTGSEYLYSNSGYFLAGVIVKRASDKSLKAFAAERIYQPLGMTHTQFRDDHTEWVAHRTTAYSPKDGGGFRIDMSNWEQVGDGAVITTVEDLLKWDNNFYTPTVGGQAMLDLLHSTTPLTGGAPNGYALGLINGTYRGVNIVSHGGAWGGYRAELLRIPSLRFAAAVLCNVPTGSPSASARRVADAMVGDKLGPLPERPARSEAEQPPAVTLDPARLATWEGTYRTPTGEVRRFAVEDGKLMLSAWGDRYPVTAIDERHMRLTAFGDPITYELRTVAGGKKQVIEVDGADSLALGALVMAKVTPALLREYQGQYYGAEVNTTITLSAAGDTLKFERPNSVALAMTSLERDHFTVDHFSVRFQRKGGRVTGFTLDMGRTRALAFTRTAR